VKTGLLVIATGENYRRYAKNFIESATKFFPPHDVILFTDNILDEFTQDFCANNRVRIIAHRHLGFPLATLMRYHTFMASATILAEYEYLFYCDADMLFVATITEDEILSDGITATLHPGYLNLPGTPERNENSAAYCPKVEKYYAGGFNGGKTDAFLRMAEWIIEGVNKDQDKNVKAVWNDESFLNRYLNENPPSKVLSPEFCYPENAVTTGYYKTIWTNAGYPDGFVPKLMALEKPKSV